MERPKPTSDWPPSRGGGVRSRDPWMFSSRSPSLEMALLSLLLKSALKDLWPKSGLIPLAQPSRGLNTLPVKGTGSTYDTEIKRKRRLKDPNEPLKEVNTKGLEWTDWRMLRDVRRRHLACEYFALKQNLVCIKLNKSLPEELKEAAHEDIKSFPKKHSITFLTNRCCITSRGRGKLRRWRLSRIIWRHLADYNYLSGVMKSTWGP